MKLGVDCFDGVTCTSCRFDRVSCYEDTVTAGARSGVAAWRIRVLGWRNGGSSGMFLNTEGAEDTECFAAKHGDVSKIGDWKGAECVLTVVVCFALPG